MHPAYNMEVEESGGECRRRHEYCVPTDKVTHGEIRQTTSRGKCATPRRVRTQRLVRSQEGENHISLIWTLQNSGPGTGSEAFGHRPSEMEQCNATNPSSGMKANNLLFLEHSLGSMHYTEHILYTASQFSL